MCNDILIRNNDSDCYKVLLQVQVSTIFPCGTVYLIDGIGGKYRFLIHIALVKKSGMCLCIIVKCGLINRKDFLVGRIEMFKSNVMYPETIFLSWMKYFWIFLCWIDSFGTYGVFLVKPYILSLILISSLYQKVLQVFEYVFD